MAARPRSVKLVGMGPPQSRSLLMASFQPCRVDPRHAAWLLPRCDSSDARCRSSSLDAGHRGPSIYVSPFPALTPPPHAARRLYGLGPLTRGTRLLPRPRCIGHGGDRRLGSEPQFWGKVCGPRRRGGAGLLVHRAEVAVVAHLCHKGWPIGRHQGVLPARRQGHGAARLSRQGLGRLGSRQARARGACASPPDPAHPALVQAARVEARRGGRRAGGHRGPLDTGEGGEGGS